jgi:VanZ family protein
MKLDSKHFLTHWLPVIVYCLAIFIQSSLPSPDIKDAPQHFDKLLHVGAYAVLAVLVMRALGAKRATAVSLPLALTGLALTGLYGLSDELHQYVVPTRDASWGDVLANAVGSAVGVVGYCMATGLRKGPNGKIPN